MPLLHLEVRRLVLPGVVGAAVSEVLVTLSIGGDERVSRGVVLGHVAAVVVGALLGLGYELVKALIEVTDRSLQQVATMEASVRQLVEQIRYQDAALQMLTALPRHNEVLSVLLTTSMTDNFRNIPYVTMATYLNILQIAIQHADRFESVQRHPVRWYRDSRNTGYLHALRDSRMRARTRLFVLDAEGRADMEQDVRDADTLADYWTHTGDVDSFWVSEADFRRNFPQIPIPEDFALFDGKLLIVYDEDRQILSFDVVPEINDFSRIFSDVRRLMADQSGTAFRRVPRTAEAGNTETRP